MASFAPDGRLLGAQAVGREGVDKRIDVLATALRAGMTADDLAELELAYAPPYGSAKDPVNMLGFVAQNALDGTMPQWHPTEVDDALARIVDRAFHSSRTATGHAKRLLHASFHRDPREMIEEVVRAQNECMTSCEMEIANRAWDERRDARFYPRPGPPA